MVIYDVFYQFIVAFFPESVVLAYGDVFVFFTVFFTLFILFGFVFFLFRTIRRLFGFKG